MASEDVVPFANSEDASTDSTVSSSVPPSSPVDGYRHRSQPTDRPSPLLPLGWTQVRRNSGTRKRKLAGLTSQTDVVDFCCDDPASCDNQGSTNHGNAATKNSAVRNQSSDVAEIIQPKGGNTVETTLQKEDESSSLVMEGQAVFCLHSLDATWFQGQFLPSSTKRPMGILAVNREDMDDCLKCADGGYREMDVTIYNRSQKKKLLLAQVSCTGGDMLSLSSSRHNDGRPKNQQVNPTCRVSFDADSVKTGIPAVPFVKLYFPTLLQTAAANPSNSRGDEETLECSSNRTEDDSYVLELLPDVAIVIGTMSLTVPRKFMGHVPSNDASPRLINQSTDDSDWLSDG